MNKLIFTILFASVCLNGVYGGSIVRISSDVEKEYDSMREKEVENLRGKNKAFSNFCLSIFDDVRGQMESSMIQMNKLNQDKLFKLMLARTKQFDRLVSILEDPRTPSKVKIQESSNFAKSSLAYVSDSIKMHSGNSGQEIEAASKFEFIFQIIQIVSRGTEGLEKGAKENFEKTKSQIIARDASVSGIKMEDLDCITLRQMLKTKVMAKFFSDNKDQIKAIFLSEN